MEDSSGQGGAERAVDRRHFFSVPLRRASLLGIIGPIAICFRYTVDILGSGRAFAPSPKVRVISEAARSRVGRVRIGSTALGRWRCLAPKKGKVSVPVSSSSWRLKGFRIRPNLHVRMKGWNL